MESCGRIAQPIDIEGPDNNPQAHACECPEPPPLVSQKMPPQLAPPEDEAEV